MNPADFGKYAADRTAYVEAEAVIGNGTRIWRWTHLGSHAVVGKNCSIGQCCEIDGVIGDDCRIQNGVQLYDGVKLGNMVFVGPNVTFTNDLRPRLGIPWAKRSTTVHDHASIGAGSVIVCGLEIGQYAMVAAGSVVTRSVPPNALVRGNPARIVGFVCNSGHQMKEIRTFVYECKACEQTMRLNYAPAADW